MNDIKISDGKTKYQGTVKITVFNDKKPKQIIKHNKGELAIFDFITHALAGESMAGLEPNNIMLQNVSGDETKNLLYTSVSYDSKPSIITENDENGNPYSSLTLTFFIPGSIVISGNINNLQLLNASSTEMATLRLNDSSIQSYAGSNIKIEWTLKVSN